MLDFNDEFKNETSRISKAWLSVSFLDGTFVTIDEERIDFNGITRDSSTTVDGEFTVGAAVTGKLSLTINNDDGSLSGYDFRGATIVAEIGGELSDGSIDSTNIGRYYVDEYTYDGSDIELIAYDDMTKFDVPCKDSNISWNQNKTISDLVDDACIVAGIGLWNSSLPGPQNYRISQPPEQWETMTWHDVISYCAQIMCCFAHIVYDVITGQYKLKFEWYDTSQMNSVLYDGGTFNTNTVPYSDGAVLDGGTFRPWNVGDAIDAGSFGDRNGVHIIPSPYSLSVDTDDVLITGVSVVLSASDNINADEDTKDYTVTSGEEGYIIKIEGNPLIETTYQANSVCSYIYSVLDGMRFRPLSASCIENPSFEAGDVAIVCGDDNETYACFLSHVTYTVNSSTQISCDAASTMQNLKARYSGAQKTNAMMQRVFERAVSNAETAMSGILGAFSTALGLRYFPSTDSAGRTIYRFGDGEQYETSRIRWEFSAGALKVSNNHGDTWNAALSVDGIAVLQEVYAIKVDADYIQAGTLTVGGNGRRIGSIIVKDSSNNTRITVDTNGIRYGKGSVGDTSAGFYLNYNGFVIGDGDHYVFASPDGQLRLHDTPGSVDLNPPALIVEGEETAGEYNRITIKSDEGIRIRKINGSSTSTPVMIHSNGEINAVGNISAQYGVCVVSPSTTSSRYRIIFMNIDYTHLYIRADDGLTYSANISASDRKLKKDIHDTGVDALDAINRIHHRAFTWKKNDKKEKIGYIAQELEEAIPGATFAVPQEDGSELLHIQDNVMIPYLSKAIQELSAKVDMLEARLATLEEK